MSGIDIFDWIVLIVIVVSVVVVFVSLAMLPGKTARQRNHPQADAINAAGWLGLLLTAGVVWALAMIWALMKPLAGDNDDASGSAETDALRARIAELEGQLEAATGVDQ